MAGEEKIPAVIVGGTGPGTLGMVRSLGRASVPIILLDEDALSPAAHSVYVRKVVSSQSSGVLMVKNLLALSASIGPSILFLNSDDAALTVSEYREDLERNYKFQLPSHSCLTSLMDKTNFQRLAEEYGFPVPRSVTVRHTADLSRLTGLRFPCIVKPRRGTANYAKALFERGYKVVSPEQAESICHRILAVVPGLVVQEWVEGPDSDLFFCLQYRATDGTTVCSFTGRKLSIWPPDVGVTASCTAAPEERPILQRLTEAFFERMSFVGMGGIEFKRDLRTGEFLMIEPTVGRVDGQEEVATLHGANIPLAAYMHEIGLSSPILTEKEHTPVIWRDFFSHRKSTAARGSHSGSMKPGTKICDAYWRSDDPIPWLFHLLDFSEQSLRRSWRQVRKKLRKSGQAHASMAASTHIPDDGASVSTATHKLD
jgi:predicted ATP-grasp superfamily ATP-dependent carboligase